MRQLPKAVRRGLFNLKPTGAHLVVSQICYGMALQACKRSNRHVCDVCHNASAYKRLSGCRYPFERPEDRNHGKRFQRILQRILRVDYSFPQSVPVSDQCKDLMALILVGAVRFQMIAAPRVLLLGCWLLLSHGCCLSVSTLPAHANWTSSCKADSVDLPESFRTSGIML